MRTSARLSIRFGVAFLIATIAGGAGAQQRVVPPIPPARGWPLGEGVSGRVDLRDVEFPNERAVLGWNLFEVLVRASTGPDPASVALPQYFDPDLPYAAYDPSDPATVVFDRKCSLAQPQFCALVQAVFGIASPPTADGLPTGPIRGGGHPRFGRRDFAWRDAPGCLPQRQGLSGLSASRMQLPAKRRGRCARR
jgi:hypothetical protein